MGNDGKEKIDAVLFITHSTPDLMQIYTDPKTGKGTFIKSTVLTGNAVISQDIGYFFLLGCRQGNSYYERSTGTSFALDLFNSKHNIDAVVASDSYSWYNEDSTRFSSMSLEGKREGDGFKAYIKTETSSQPIIVSIGYRFSSFSKMYASVKKAVKVVTPGNAGMMSIFYDSYANIGTVTWNGTPKLKLREGPGTGFKIIRELDYGEKFEYLSYAKSGGRTWYRVKMLSGGIQGEFGWIASEYTDYKLEG